MGIITKPHDFTTGDIIASEVNADFDEVYTEINGNLDNDNIKAGANIEGSKLLANSVTATQLANSAVTEGEVDYTSVKVMRLGPNFSGGANGRRTACGAKAFTLASGVVTLVITFNGDSVDGNPAFAAAPNFHALVEHAAGNPSFDVQITSRLASSVTVRIRSIQTTGTPGAVDGGDNSSGTLIWEANGPI